jgi:hypothetical protein
MSSPCVYAALCSVMAEELSSKPAKRGAESPAQGAGCRAIQTLEKKRQAKVSQCYCSIGTSTAPTRQQQHAADPQQYSNSNTPAHQHTNTRNTPTLQYSNSNTSTPAHNTTIQQHTTTPAHHHTNTNTPPKASHHETTHSGCSAQPRAQGRTSCPGCTSSFHRQRAYVTTWPWSTGGHNAVREAGKKGVLGRAVSAEKILLKL